MLGLNLFLRPKCRRIGGGAAAFAVVGNVGAAVFVAIVDIVDTTVFVAVADIVGAAGSAVNIVGASVFTADIVAAAVFAVDIVGTALGEFWSSISWFKVVSVDVLDTGAKATSPETFAAAGATLSATGDDTGHGFIEAGALESNNTAAGATTAGSDGEESLQIPSVTGTKGEIGLLLAAATALRPCCVMMLW
jgi:hypothetical protein